MGTALMNDTAAAQRAIDTYAAAGGGCVVVSPGPAMTVGAIRPLRSRVELHLGRRAVLKSSPQHKVCSITIPYPVQLNPAARRGSKHPTRKPERPGPASNV